MPEEKRFLRRSATLAARAVRVLIALVRITSIRTLWQVTCEFMTRKFPNNVIFPRYERVMTTEIPAMAVIKRKPVGLVEVLLCDRCGARAVVKADIGEEFLLFCNHHKEEHLPQLIAEGRPLHPLNQPASIEQP